MVYILLGNGFEEIEAIAPCDILRRAGIEVQLVGLNGYEITGGHGICIHADITIDRLDLDEIEMIVLPGGMGGVASIKANEFAIRAIQYAWNSGRYVAAICAAPTILSELGITDYRKVTCYPGLENNLQYAIYQSNSSIVADGMLLTSAGPGTAYDFGLMLVEVLKGTVRAQEVYDGLVYRLARPEFK